MRLSYHTGPSAPILAFSFGKLPTEIRTKIWIYAAHIPRNIDLWARYHDRLEQVNMMVGVVVPQFLCHRYSSFCAHPAMLQATHESRAIGLKYYTLTFGTHGVLRYGIEISIPARIYVNWESDVILPMGMEASQKRFDWRHQVFNNPDFPIQNLAIDIQAAGLFEVFYYFPAKHLILYRRQPSQEPAMGVYREQYTIELVDLDKARAENSETEMDASERENLEAQRAKFQQQLADAGLAWTYRAWKARDDWMRNPGRDLFISAQSIRDNIQYGPLPCPKFTLAQTRVYRGIYH